MDPVFERNIPLTATERLMLNSRPKNPKYARNKNILVIGGSGSGKTRFFVKPSLMQMHSSYVVTDPKGTVLVECGKMLVDNGYKVKVLNTINFRTAGKEANGKKTAGKDHRERTDFPEGSIEGKVGSGECREKCKRIGNAEGGAIRGKEFNFLQYFAYRKPEIHDRGILEVTFNLWYNDSYPVMKL